MPVRTVAKRQLAAIALFSLMLTQLAPHAAAPPPALDLIQDRPSLLERAWDHSARTLSATWTFLYDNVFDWITPPSPSAITGHVTKEDTIALFKLLSDTGYKLKEIETHVGIIPTMSFKFGQVRELSEADLDYLYEQLDHWHRLHSGLSVSLQRAIVDTVLTVNQSTNYQVSSLTVQLLPLPRVAFKVSPKITALDEENSVLMLAIQRVDRSLLELRREFKQ